MNAHYVIPEMPKLTYEECLDRVKNLRKLISNNGSSSTYVATDMDMSKSDEELAKEAYDAQFKPPPTKEEIEEFNRRLYMAAFGIF